MSDEMNTPWTGYDGEAPQIVDSKGYSVLMVTDGATAEGVIPYIVHCVNEHDRLQAQAALVPELVEALEGVLNDCKFYWADAENIDGLKCAIDGMRQVIATARAAMAQEDDHG